jgi:hypothetical protein
MKLQISLLTTAALLVLVPITVAKTSWPIAGSRLGISPEIDKASVIPLADINLQLNPVHPDEPVSDTLEQRFSLSTSLKRLQQIESGLVSFHRLTKASQSALGKQAIAAIGNTDWETQALGFPNWVGSIRGTLKKQDYQIKQLELELAKKQHKDGEITQAELDQKVADYKKAEQEFQSFWHAFGIAD